MFQFPNNWWNAVPSMFRIPIMVFAAVCTLIVVFRPMCNQSTPTTPKENHIEININNTGNTQRNVTSAIDSDAVVKFKREAVWSIEDTISTQAIRKMADDQKANWVNSTLEHFISSPSIDIEEAARKILIQLHDESKEGKIAPDVMLHGGNGTDRGQRYGPMLWTYRESFSYDSLSNSVKYVVEFAVPKSIEDYIPAEMRNSVKAQAKQVIPSFSPVSAGGSITINTNNVIILMKADTVFKNRMKDLLERYMDQLRLFDDETFNNFAELTDTSIIISNYRSAEYVPNGLIRMILSIVAEAVQVNVSNIGPLRIVVMGYADQTGVGRLEYNRGGCWDNGGAPVALGNATCTQMRPFIESNLELSYARAYNGATIIDQDIRRKSEIDISYLGKGVDNVNTTEESKWKARRIEITVQKR
jgi:hypothetical protein